MIFRLVSLLIFGITINGHEEFHAEPHIRQIPWLPNLVQHDDDNNADNKIPVLNNYLDGFSSTASPPSAPQPIQLPVVNRPLQVTLLAVILTAAVFANGSVIANISRDSLKLRMVHFLLIRHVCIADCLGAILVLPVPLVAIVQGEWGYGDNVCAAVSTTTASLWTMHLLAVALYRADRVLAVWLPTGRYPIFSVRTTNICLVIIWGFAILGSYGATYFFGHTFQPALALCIPNVPLVFFIIVFAGYCIGLVSLTTGYVLAFARRRRRKRKREKESKLYAELGENAPFEPTPDDLIEDVESCGNTSERGRHRRALSDQFSASKPPTFIPSAKLTHRRVWSESAAAYCPSNLTSIVNRSNQMSYDSSSFPQNSSDTNINDYDRLTEDDGSSDFSVRKLTHSQSFDGSTTSQTQTTQQQLQHQSQQPSVRKGFLFAQSKSFDQADISSKHRNNQSLSNHFNSMTMYESVVRSSNPKSIKSGGDKAIFTSNLVIKPSTKPGLYEDVTCELDDCNRNALSKASPDTHLYSYNECMGEKNKSTAGEKLNEKKMVPLSLYSWPLENTMTAPAKNTTNVIGVIIENQSSACGSSDSVEDIQRIPRSHPVPRHTSRPTSQSQEYNFSVDPNAICSAGASSQPESSEDQVEGNNNTKQVNSEGKRGESDNNNTLQVRMVKKSRPRTRVKHFRHKGKTGPAKRAIASYAVSVGHLLLYLPAMFVVGLKGATLPPSAALFCGIVVYCEFLVQPVALLLVSPRLRIEVVKTIFYLMGLR